MKVVSKLIEIHVDCNGLNWKHTYQYKHIALKFLTRNKENKVEGVEKHNFPECMNFCGQFN